MKPVEFAQGLFSGAGDRPGAARLICMRRRCRPAATASSPAMSPASPGRRSPFTRRDRSSRRWQRSRGARRKSREGNLLPAQSATEGPGGRGLDVGVGAWEEESGPTKGDFGMAAQAKDCGAQHMDRCTPGTKPFSPGLRAQPERSGRLGRGPGRVETGTQFCIRALTPESLRALTPETAAEPLSYG